MAGAGVALGVELAAREIEEESTGGGSMREAFVGIDPAGGDDAVSSSVTEGVFLVQREAAR